MDRDARVAARPPRPRPDFAIEDHLIEMRDGIYFVDKPAGWPTSGRTLEDEACVQYRLMEHTRKKIWAVHQLDADTSGLNIFTHRRSSVHDWQKRLRYPSSEKEYLAIVHGRLDTPRKIHTPIGRRQDGTWGVHPTGKAACTHVIPVHATDDFSWVRVRLRTGRTHQIRVHLSDIGHPLVGEFWYNDAPCLLAERHMLHAWRTEFDARDDLACAIARPPADFLHCAQTLFGDIPESVDGESLAQSIIRRRAARI